MKRIGFTSSDIKKRELNNRLLTVDNTMTFNLGNMFKAHNRDIAVIDGKIIDIIMHKENGDEIVILLSKPLVDEQIIIRIEFKDWDLVDPSNLNIFALNALVHMSALSQKDIVEMTRGSGTLVIYKIIDEDGYAEIKARVEDA